MLASSLARGILQPGQRGLDLRGVVAHPTEIKLAGIGCRIVVMRRRHERGGEQRVRAWPPVATRLADQPLIAGQGSDAQRVGLRQMWG